MSSTDPLTATRAMLPAIPRGRASLPFVRRAGASRLAMLPLALLTLMGGVMGMAGHAASHHTAPVIEVQTTGDGETTTEAPTETPNEAQDGAAAETGPMTVGRASEVFTRLDEAAEIAGGGRLAQFTIEGTDLLFVSDPANNRMRLMTRIGPAEALSPEQLMRIAQANFDTTLDARYAVAQGQLWSVFIHPLRELTETQLIEAVGQVVNAASSFGTTYSSGLLSFGGGDAAAAQRALIDDLLNRGEPI